MVQIKRNRCPTKQVLVPQPGASPASPRQAVLSKPWGRAVPQPPAPGPEAFSRRAALPAHRAASASPRPCRATSGAQLAQPRRAGRGVSHRGRLSPRNTTGDSQPEKPTLQHERLFKTDARTACKALPTANFPGGGCDHHPLPSLLAVPEAWCLVPGAGCRIIVLIPCPLCTAGIVFQLVKCIYLAGVMSQGMISTV